MKLYKYFHEDRMENILKDGLIRFTQPQELNDPFELRPYIVGIADDMEMDGINFVSSDEIIKDAYETNFKPFHPNISFDTFAELYKLREKDMLAAYLGSPKATLNDFIKHLLKSQPTIQMINQKFYEVSNRVIGILSLTSKNDNLLMWAHYANSHKGFVVEFNIENVFFNQTVEQGKFYGTPEKVIYAQNRPSGYFSELYNNFLDTFLTKSPEWEYEEEYRMLLPLSMANQVVKENIFCIDYRNNQLLQSILELICPKKIRIKFLNYLKFQEIDILKYLKQKYLIQFIGLNFLKLKINNCR